MANLFAELKSKVTVTEAAEEVNESNSIKRDPYGDPKYWEERYVNGEEKELFEWLLSWHELEAYITPELKKCGGDIGTILHPGCGNSTLGTDMRKAGYGLKGILNTDISPTVIENMNKLYGLECIYLVDDALNMINANNSDFKPFNAVVDKGTLDAFTCTDSIIMKKKIVETYLNEVYNLLKIGGYFIMISFGIKETRLQYFNINHWKLCGEVLTIRNTCESSSALNQCFYMYVFEKIEP